MDILLEQTVIRHPQHEPGCWRTRIARSVVGSGRASNQPSLRNRWSCPNCQSWKIGKKFNHMVVTEKVVAMRLLTPHEIGAACKYAKRHGQGYATVVLPDLSYRLFISTPEGVKGGFMTCSEQVLPMIRLFARAFGVSRISFSESWKPPKNPQEQVVAVLRTVDRDESHEIMVESGLVYDPGRQDYNLNGLTSEEMRQNVHETLNGDALFTNIGPNSATTHTPPTPHAPPQPKSTHDSAPLSPPDTLPSPLPAHPSPAWMTPSSTRPPP